MSPTETRNIVSFSGGKDSTAMLHLLLERGLPIDEIVYFETEWDFPQMADHVALVGQRTGPRITHVLYYRHFNEILSRWGWPKSQGGWCTANKHRTCKKFVQGVHGAKIEYIGFSTDELHRTQTGWMKERRWPVRFPLIEEGFSEADSLAYCKRLGYHWDGLYEVFDRVSCFCCPKAGKTRRRLIHDNFPELWSYWQQLDKIAEGAHK